MKISKWILSVAAASMLAACGPGGNGKTTKADGDVAVPGTALGDMTLGKADAPVTIIEYASITCPHCADWHDDVFPALEKRIEAGEVKFIFREFPTPPQDIALAGFAIARCAGEAKYFDALDDFFANQDKMIQAARTGTVGDFLRATAARYGVDANEFQACTRDDVLYGKMIEIIEGGSAMGVNSTPSFFLNGERMGREAQVVEELNAAIDAALGIEPAPAAEPEAEATEPEAEAEVTETEATETPAEEASE